MDEKTVIVRRMRIDELEEVQRLYAQQIEADDNPLTALTCGAKKHAWEMRRLRQQLLSEQRYLVYVALEEGGERRIIGYTAAVLEHQARLFAVDTVASVDELWVEPDWRRRGVGKALLDQLFGAIEELGIDWVKVHFPENAAEAKSLFTKAGFVQKSVEMQMHLNDEQ